jgi:CRP-like cAMP-binding protein
MSRKISIIVPKIEEVKEIWDLLTEEDRVLLIQNANLKHYRRNELIHCEGDIPTHMMILVRGKVKIYKNGVGGRTQIVRMLKPNAWFGYRAIFSTKSYHGYNTNAMATEDSSIYQIPASTINTLLHRNASLAYNFIVRLADELGASDARVVSLTQKHVRARLAETILFLKDNYGFREDGSTLDVCLSRDDIASLSNMTTSNAIRTLSGFAKEEIIKIEGRKIKILDEEQLFRINKMG